MMLFLNKPNYQGGVAKPNTNYKDMYKTYVSNRYTPKDLIEFIKSNAVSQTNSNNGHYTTKQVAIYSFLDRYMIICNKEEEKNFKQLLLSFMSDEKLTVTRTADVMEIHIV